ncbi:MAG: phosphoribosylformylglycinamidine synthase subunit PurL [Meiothermus sp.]|uniref:phosphoribosylformylglycinamidine synthase subunit PurL n=1 Tax=Meiothermus sp. TaxID=1955249 RepID=UPI0025F755AD|nr:phosphoribosylformylglycinamidine synthase subunit PurL [Meiothermus sp.]MCS7195355.1 phosphoribosylformylglycinamidine synthase subunit PurL [Meiothermus sp.]MDW8090243.1 phosphoribosylformylglycinamidine synthase subunit PurL [Meiothermus sp.]MDW8481209.1 phosphoribosylformylglycinamidine synthase subunit PurL [Meiothermus sp.]
MQETLPPLLQETGIPLHEYQEIVRLLGREPNRLELYLFKVMWSEHCAYKNSRPLLGLLPKDGPAVLQGPGENAGVVDIGEGWAVAFKIESHNHPSAVEPVQGAATGVGGIIRDIVAMGARPIALLNSLRFGELSSPRTRYLLRGVVGGIAHYGNAIGVPTVGGEVYFHPAYQENPLVNAMCVGLLRVEELKRSRASLGRPVYYVGSKTGRDGIGGAAFASEELSEENESKRPSVQVGDPFMGKLTLEATLEAIRQGLVEGVQDMGAAGLTSSLSEMAHKSGLGLELNLDRVPRREPGMTPLELMLSESQERMVLVPRPGKEKDLEALAARYGLDAVPVAHTVAEPVFRVVAGGEVVAEVPIRALAEAPTYVREGREDPAIARARARDLSDLPLPQDLEGVLPRLLATPNLCSRSPIFERYDHQVGTNTVLLPGRGDAAILRIKGTRRAIAVKVDANPRYCRLAPRLGAMHALAEAARNVSVVGARPLAYTDGLNLGNPETPEGYFELSETLQGLAEASRALGLPVVSGNVSLYNEGPSHRIPPTPMVGVLGLLEEVERRAELGFRKEGEFVVLIGPEGGYLGASEYLWLEHGLEAGSPPPLELALEARVQAAIRELIRRGWVQTAHDVAEGGLAVALAEMCFSYGLGATVELRSQVRPDALLFGEAPSRVLFTVDQTHLHPATKHLEEAGLPYRILGQVGGDRLTILLPKARLEWGVGDLRRAWEAPLREVLP